MRSVTNRVCAICRLVWPAAASWATRSSLGVSASRPRTASRRGRPPAMTSSALARPASAAPPSPCAMSRPSRSRSRATARLPARRCAAPRSISARASSSGAGDGAQHRHRLGEQLDAAVAAGDQAGRAQRDAQGPPGAPAAGQRHLGVAQRGGGPRVAQRAERQRGVRAPGHHGRVADAPLLGQLPGRQQVGRGRGVLASRRAQGAPGVPDDHERPGRAQLAGQAAAGQHGLRRGQLAAGGQGRDQERGRDRGDPHIAGAGQGLLPVGGGLAHLAPVQRDQRRDRRAHRRRHRPAPVLGQRQPGPGPRAGLVGQVGEQQHQDRLGQRGGGDRHEPGHGLDGLPGVGHGPVAVDPGRGQLDGDGRVQPRVERLAAGGPLLQPLQQGGG